MIKIGIDTKKLIDGEIQFDDKEKYSENNINQVMEQLKYHINNGNNSCFLMSGYRGVGKTTIVDKLEKELSNAQHIFVRVNISKYEQHNFIMRKLIRQLYEEYTKKTQGKINNLYGKRGLFKKQIELLYERTFYEVIQMNSRKRQSNIDISMDVKTTVQSISKLAMAILTLIITTKYDLTKSITNKNLLEILTTLWVIFEGANFATTLKYSGIKSDEINRKSLYDDEIAELKLKNILEELKKLDFKIIIVLDELDKIENEEDMNKILAELKPLFLSNLSNFIVISGQKLYYKIYNSKTVDDALISNIFSRSIHVPLSKNDELYKLIEVCICEEDIKEDYVKKVKDDYINSVILRSNTTIRLLKNIILQDIKWIDGKSYVEISDYKKSKFETDSKILQAIRLVIRKDIESYNDDIVIKDFFTYQLYLWGKKLQLVGREQFSVEDIFDFDKEYGNDYPHNCKNKLIELLVALLNILSSEDIKLMDKDNKGTEDNPIYLYKWLDEVEISEESEMEYMSNMRKSFIDSFILIEKYCRNIYINIIDKSNKYPSMREMINNLFKLEIITYQQCENLKEYSNLRNSIVHGNNMPDYNIDIFRNANREINNNINSLLERYLYYACKQFFNDTMYTIQHVSGELNKVFDLDVITNEPSKQNYFFVIKRISRISRQNYDKRVVEILEEVERVSYYDNKEYIIIILMYIDESTKEFNKYINESIDRINVKRNIKIYNIVEPMDFNIQGYLEQIIQGNDKHTITSLSMVASNIEE